MFASISLATPNSTVTSSFTAVEKCRVGVGEGYTVRVNGQVVPSRTIDLVVNDLIEMDVVAPAGGAYVFVPWTYNGVQSYFAVVCKQASNNPSLIGIYRGKMWYDLPVSMYNFMSQKKGSTESTLSETYIEGQPQTADLVTFIDPTNKFVFFYRPDNSAMARRISLTSKPMAMTRMFNGLTRTWETYVLTQDGFISKIDYNWAVTKSNAAITDAKSIFSDGITLYVGGINYVKVLSDLNTVTATYAVTDTIVYGAALGSTVMVASSSGKISKLQGGQFTTIYQTTMVGSPVVFQNQIVFPIVEEYKLRVFATDGSFVRDIDTGAKLPWAVSANRNTSLVVAYADSQSVDVFTSLAGTPTPSQVSFSYKVTFAQQVGTTMYASHYLREYTLTMPPNPPVNGVTFPRWQAPIGVDVGSGEFVTATQASSLQAAVSPNATLMINGIVNPSSVGNDQRVAVMLRSAEGHQKAAVVLGNYAFDFRVDAQMSDSFSTQILIPNKFVANQVVYTITVPNEVVNAPIAVSHGTLKLNNTTYNGSTPVNEGDVLTITLNVPVNTTTYWSMLSIADSQFALTVSTTANRVADTQRYQPYLNRTTKSTFKIDDAGIYNFPNYSFAEVRKDGQLLAFPTTLAANDVVEITHTPMSSWWFDERDTVLIGPNTIYTVQGITAVDDIPNNVDFGTVHLGIPDFDFPADQPATIQGISDKYAIAIFGDNMKFSVNGADPIVSPLVRNGDVVQVIYTVQNLWEDRYVKTILYDGRPYEFGIVHVDPPLGVNYELTHEVYYEPTFWVEVDQENAIDASMIVGSWSQDSQLSSQASVAQFSRDGLASSASSTSMWEMGPLMAATAASTGLWEKGPLMATTIMASPLWEQAPTISKTIMADPQWEDNASQFKTPLPKAVGYQPITFASWDPKTSNTSNEYTYTVFDIEENFTTSYGHMVIFRTFDAYWEPFQDISSRSVRPDWIQYLTSDEKIFDREFFMGPLVTFAQYAPGNFYVNQGPELPVFISGIHDDPNRTWVNPDSGEAAFEAWDHDVFVDLNPVFETMQKQLFGIQVPVFVGGDRDFSGLFNFPAKVQDAVLLSQAPAGLYADDKHWDTTLPLLTGGFPDDASAATAGALAAGKLTFETYKQPEGSFSYVIKRDTGLVCKIKTGNFVVGKWLLGGG